MPDNTDKMEMVGVDPRLYLGILVFRWKLIVICFLYCLLVGVIYLQVVPRQYLTSAVIMIFRDPNTQIGGQTYVWEEGNTHVDLLKSDRFNERIATSLEAQWAEKLGSSESLRPPLIVNRLKTGGGITIEIDIQNTHPAYARAYLERAIQDFQSEREALKDFTAKSASKVLEEQLARLEDKIRAAEDDVVEFQRLNQMEYVQLKGQLELGYLQQLMGRQQQLSTEQWMLELEFPRLKGANAEVIRNVMDLTYDTGKVSPLHVRRGEDKAGKKTETQKGEGELTFEDQDVMPETGTSTEATEESPFKKTMERGFVDLRIRLAKLEKQKADLAGKLQPGHPQIKAMDDEIQDIQKQLDLHAELEFKQGRERHDAIGIQLDALEEAQRRWKNSYLLASRKGADLRHLQAAVSRLEGMHASLYSRLGDVKIEEEMKAERFSVVRAPRTEPKAVWPDPFKILIAALMVGLGSGLGLALMIHAFDNKVQSVSDVESAVGVPFLGGIPYWIQSEMIGRVRPIVSEEHRSGAAEAYRALRTNILAALDKQGKKVVLVTSADSKEGKTLTALNLAIMIAKAGKKVLLADMDLRRGVLNKSFEMERKPGITDVMHERGSLRSVIRPTTYENLWFAPAGSTERNTSELLHMVDLAAMISEIMGDYDYVLMDTAPVLRATDTVVLAGVPFTTVIYVAHANRTPKPMIRYSLDMLGDAHVLGLILNSIEMNKISSLYYTYQYPNYAYYSYSYAYGYDYYLYDERGRRNRAHPRRSLKSVGHSIAQWLRRTFLPME